VYALGRGMKSFTIKIVGTDKVLGETVAENFSAAISMFEAAYSRPGYYCENGGLFYSDGTPVGRLSAVGES
jgi:hypothetical protein